MNIVLVGMRGSGKSTIGKKLAESLHKHFIEMDRTIETEQRMTIQEIVNQFGWQKFRELESELVKDLHTVDQAIIATGGGVVLEDTNRDMLKKNGLVIWLTAPIEDLVQRIGDDPNRVLLTDASTMKGDLETVFSQRKHLYEQMADYIVETHEKTDTEIINEIITLIQSL